MKDQELTKDQERNPVSEVFLRRRMSPWNYRVTIEHAERVQVLYEGQSGVNAVKFYSASTRTTVFLGATATVRLATLDGKREIGGFITTMREGVLEQNHSAYGIEKRS